MASPGPRVPQPWKEVLEPTVVWPARAGMSAAGMSVARFSPDGSLVAAAASDARLRLYAVDGAGAGAVLREVAAGEFHARAINDIAWAPSGRQLATGGEDCAVVAWRVEVGADGAYAVRPRRVLRGHAAAVTALRYNPRGTLIASGSVDEKVILWNVKGASQHKLLNAHSRPVVSVDFSYDGRLVLSASHDGYMRIWDALDGMALRILSGAPELTPLLYARFSPNAQYAVATYVSGHARMVNVTDKVNVKTYAPPAGPLADQTSAQSVREAAFCRPDMLLVAAPAGVLFYDVNSQRCGRVHEARAPPRCIDAADARGLGLCAGAGGVELFGLHA